MNAGVWTVPCGVSKTPARALPEVPSISNEKVISCAAKLTATEPAA
jgi:hypothetical protein